jgi:class 3 adenylate cyclase
MICSVATEQMVCLMFTDVVESTALASRVGPEVAELLRREHFGLLREAIAAAGGREVKSRGDGLMAAFASAVAATRCAVTIQRALERRNRWAEHPLEARIGISLGDVVADGGDYYGWAVVEGARLCDEAARGQILATEVVRLTAGGRDDYSFQVVGELELKGFPAPVLVSELVWQPLAPVASAIPLPARIRGATETGRERERAHVQRLWQRVLAGERNPSCSCSMSFSGSIRPASRS